MGAVVVTASSISADTPAQSETTPSQASPCGLKEVPVALRINGQERQLQLEPRVTLLDALRKNLRLFATKKGGDHGQCGACTVHLNGGRVNSCLTFASMHQRDEITTIEGLDKDRRLHRICRTLWLPVRIRHIRSDHV